MELEVLVLSQTGGRAVNEDAGGYWSSNGACFCVLSDGAGGHAGGEVASKLAVQGALGWFRATPDCSPMSVKGALYAANQAIVQEQNGDARLADMRATVVVLAIDTERGLAAWGHLGDTRLYCFRQGRIVTQTRDHSVAQSMVDAGLVRAQDLRTLPGRSQLSGALGDAEQFDPAVVGETLAMRDGDTFLLCTDGLWEYVTESDMERSLAQARTANDWLRALESQVLARSRVGHDNYSALTVWCTEADEATCPGI